MDSIKVITSSGQILDPIKLAAQANVLDLKNSICDKTYINPDRQNLYLQNVLVVDLTLHIQDLISLANELNLDPVFVVYFEFASDDSDDDDEEGIGSKIIPRPQFMIIQSGKDPLAVQEGVDLELQLDQIFGVQVRLRNDSLHADDYRVEMYSVLNDRNLQQGDKINFRIDTTKGNNKRWTVTLNKNQKLKPYLEKEKLLPLPENQQQPKQKEQHKKQQQEQQQQQQSESLGLIKETLKQFTGLFSQS